MQGKQHRQGNIFISITVMIYLILHMHYSYWYLLMPPISYYVADFPDIDQIKTVPKKWKLFKSIVINGFRIIILLAIGIFIYTIYKLYYKSTPLTPNDYFLFMVSMITIGSFALIGWYVSTDNGKFLMGHRGFTHTPVIPAALALLYITVYNVIDYKADGGDVTYYLLNVSREVICVLIMGVLIGYLGHLFLDSLCKAGIPLLWPLSKSSISFGNAITSDKRAKDGTHISSKIYTYVVCALCVVISGYLIYLKI